MKITVTAKTEKGTEALKQHVKESTQTNKLKKAMFRQAGFIQLVPCQDPLTVVIELRNRRIASLIKPEHMKDNIIEVMKENGAEEKDYSLEVE